MTHPDARMRWPIQGETKEDYAQYMEDLLVMRGNVIRRISMGVAIGSEWHGKGAAAKYQRIKVVDIRRDGRIVFVRTAGVPKYRMNVEAMCTAEQLRSAYAQDSETSCQ